MSIPPVTPAPDDRSEEFRQLLRFIREENEAYRAASRNEAEAVRNVLTHSIQIIAYPVAAVIALFTLLLAFAGWMGLRSWHEMKIAIRTQADAATQTEVKAMRQKIDHQLTQEFEDKKIQDTIRASAREATATEARPLIKSEVSRQVSVEQAAIRKSYSKQFENEFNRIRDFRANLHVTVSPTLSNPGRFAVFAPSVYLKRGTDLVAEFGPVTGQSTVMANAGNPPSVVGFIHPEDLYPPFKANLLNKRIIALEGINKIDLNFNFMATKDQIDQLLEFLKGIASAQVDLVLNSVTLYQVQISPTDFKVPDDPKSLADGNYTIEMNLDPSFFRNTEKEFQTAASK